MEKVMGISELEDYARDLAARDFPPPVVGALIQAAATLEVVKILRDGLGADGDGKNHLEYIAMALSLADGSSPAYNVTDCLGRIEERLTEIIGALPQS